MYFYLSLTHKISVSLFLIIYLFKALMLIANHKETLKKFSRLVKIPEMIISVLFLATGVYMLIKGGHPELYMMVKIVLVLASIPLAVIGIRKEKKLFLVLSVVILIYVYGIAETHSLTFTHPSPEGLIENVEDDNYQIKVHGLALYQQHCLRCHGEQGDKMRYESPDISTTSLDKEQRWAIINNGKGMMPAFGKKLDKNEKKALEEYLLSLKK
ncbi:c-type cytochrome [Hyphobacterium sp. CCMP332]|nr:c-type cytochrome [Hyphobacterium sp. CCMP332]